MGLRFAIASTYVALGWGKIINMLGLESEGQEAFILVASTENADNEYKLRSAPKASSMDRS